MRYLLFLFTIIVLALSPLVSAGELPSRLAAGDGMEWYEDAAEEFASLEDLREAEDRLQWQVAEGAGVSLGFTPTPHWFRFDVGSVAPEEVTRYLHIPEALLNRIDVFVLRNGEVVQQQSMGQDFPFDQRPIAHREFAMPVALSEEFPTRFYVRVQASSSLQFEPFLWEPTAFTEYARLGSIASGLFYGLLLMMMVYNLFIYFVVRDRSYLYYIFVVAVFMLFMGTLHGDAYQFLWPQWVRWNETSVTFAVAALSVVTLIFTNSFLELRRNWPLVYYIFCAMLLHATLLAVLSFVLDYNTSIQINSLTGLAVMPAVMTAGIVMWSRGHHHARYFVMAWLAWLLGTSILALSKFGVLPWNALTANGAQMGAVLKMLLLSFALGDRINQERAERQQAQEHALAAAEEVKSAQHELLEAKEKANRELEFRVKERTQELEQAMEKLETVNQFLEEVSNTDQLTGLSNRHCFVRRYHEEYKRAQRHQNPISIILMDIDHFKSFNDTHGHIAGDECLKAVAGVFSRVISRAGDMVARFGGEEFIVLLSNTGIEGAEVVGERLRQAVSDLVIQFEGEVLPVTISVGVASEVPRNLTNAEHLIQNADDALYAAKEGGRNRVCLYPDDVAAT